MSQSHIRYFLIVFLLHFNRKAESTFLSTEKDNVYNKNNTPGDKNLFVSKNPKKNKFDTSIELQSKSNEANNKFQQIRTQKKTLNRKNVTDGRVRLVVAQNDCVPEDYLNDYRDNPFDSLEQTPWRITSYVESK